MEVIMDRKDSIIASVISIALGFMLIVMKGSVIRLAITCLGVYVLVSAALSFAGGLTNIGIVKAVIGVGILVFGWVFVNLALYILAASIIVMGLLQIENIHRFAPGKLSLKDKVFIYAKPVVTVLAGACLLFIQGGTIAWVFVATGILLIIEGIIELFDAFRGY